MSHSLHALATAQNISAVIAPHITPRLPGELGLTFSGLASVVDFHFLPSSHLSPGVLQPQFSPTFAPVGEACGMQRTQLDARSRHASPVPLYWMHVRWNAPRD